MTAAKYPPAQGPKGVIVRIRTAQGKLSSELLEVRETGIVVADQKLRFVPYTGILSAEEEKTGSLRYAIHDRKVPKPGVREHLRLLSRFPNGLTPELVQQLLNVYGQAELAGPDQ